MKPAFPALDHCRWRRAALILLVLALVTGSLSFPAAAAAPASGVNLTIDGRKVTSTPAPFIENGRTLVPVRLISEELGATVAWNPDARTVDISRGDRHVLMRIDNRLVDLPADQVTVSDVPPRIYSDRTFVPVRLLATALGVSVDWDGTSKTVIVSSQGPVQGAPVRAVSIAAVRAGQTISEPVTLQLSLAGDASAEPGSAGAALPGAAEVRWQLLDPSSGRGPVIARGSSLTAAYSLLPDPFYAGPRVLAVGVYDKNGSFLAGDAVPVIVAPVPRVALAGVTEGQTVTGPVRLGAADLNFQTVSLEYTVTDPATGETETLTSSGDPQGQWTWTPGTADNGTRSLQVKAYDREGRAYSSQPVTVTVAAQPWIALTGVRAGSTINHPVTLGVSANFPIAWMQYILRDLATGAERVLYQPAGGAESYRWFPGPDRTGRYEILAAAGDASGKLYVTDPVAVTVDGSARVLLQTIGPDQVLHGNVSLRAVSNVPLSRMQFELVNPQTGAARAIAGGADPLATYTWTPAGPDDGNWQIRAVGTTAGGARLAGEAVPVRIHSGTIYGPKPVMEKSLFQGFASDLARKTMARTGMSAALQVAQAILESGWGQSSPVDKYTGMMSYNLFGIKGTGPAGSVTSNTWEEYNGVTYYIDDAFRAYHNASESWDDHAQLLLTKSWYGPFRDVMYDSTQGAWALRRCGYATDSKYPVRLIDIINRYGLYHLDEVGI